MLQRVVLTATITGLAMSVPSVHAADLILTNGKVYTVDSQRPWAEAIAIKEGLIEYVGHNEDALNLAQTDAEIIDLQGLMVLPGIHDVHMHPLEAGNPVAGTCEMEAGTDPEEYIPRFKQCAPKQVGSDWIMGSGFYAADLLNTRRPPVEILNQGIPDQPALMIGMTSHSYWANSEALALAGVDANTPDPIGGVFVRDAVTGKPNGILLDNAGIIVDELAMKPHPELLDLTYEGLLEQLTELSRNGITSIADARVFWTRKHHQVWQRAEQENKLTARVTGALWAYPEKDDDQIEILKSMYSNDPDSLLKFNQIKVYMDGIVGTTTAAMKKRYAKDFGWIEGNRGLNYFTQERLTKYMVELEKEGFDFLIHTIGDRGIHEALNTIEATAQTNGNNVDRRHRLTHVEVLDKAEANRFKELNVVADFQVAGDWSHPEVYQEEEWLIGHRAHGAIPIRTVYDAGATITLSSDYDVNDMNPFVGMQNALTRGDESLPDLQSVIAAYTLNAAYSLRQENLTGSLEPGKAADLIVIDRNLFEIPYNQINKTQVLWTLLAGEEVYRSDDF